MNRKIKVYACSDEEWVAARTSKTALKFYLSKTGVDFEYDMDSKMPEEVCESEMNRLQYLEDGEPEEGTHKSFKAKLAEIVKTKEKFPCWFAISDY